MKRRIYRLSVVVLLFVCGALVGLRQAPHHSLSATLPDTGKISQVLAADAPPPMPTKFFQFNHEPTNPEEQVIWDWWFYMNKKDLTFQWRTPLNFYGVVTDQHGVPVPEARVSMVWNGENGSVYRKMVGGADGRFELVGEKGKALTVDVDADGWVSDSSHQGFDYSAFWAPLYYVPDKANPLRSGSGGLKGQNRCIFGIAPKG